MASASPIAFTILLMVMSTVLLPLFWCFLAGWQQKHLLSGLFRFSLVALLSLLLPWLVLYFGREVSAKYSMIFLLIAPYFNIFLFLVVLCITAFKITKKHSS